MAVTPAAILWPLRFPAETYALRVRYQSVTETLTFSADYSWVDFWVNGADSFLQRLEECLDTHSEVVVHHFDVSLVDFRVRVANTVSNGFRILWDDPATTLDKDIFGFVESMASSVETIDGPNMPKGIWRPQRLISKDSRNRQPIVGAVGRAISGATRTARLAAPLKERDLSFELVEESRALTEYAGEDEPYNTFEAAWVGAISAGYPMRLCEDETDLATSTTYKTRDLEDPLKMRSSNAHYWDASLRLVRQETE